MTPSPILGSLLGTALGDAIGLPYEGLSRERGAKMLHTPDRHRFLFGKGMVSDDTEHTCMVLQSLILSGGDLTRFQKSLAWRFRFWLLCLPAGVGLATARAILRLWIGFPPTKSGVFSAGNGPAMRAAILGVMIQDRKKLATFVEASTRITHTDPKAKYGALAVALAAQMSQEKEPLSGERFLTELQLLLGKEGEELLTLISAAVHSAQNGETTATFAASLDLASGVTGYVYHTVPVVLQCWLKHPTDYQVAITSIIQCGGDTDTTAAILGGIIGAAVGKKGLPEAWLKNLYEWPLSVSWIEHLATQAENALQTDTGLRPLRLPLWKVIPRNILFLGVVLFHGFRRLLPPY